jgi:anhydro-N-acetylmuramic acid kinase
MQAGRGAVKPDIGRNDPVAGSLIETFRVGTLMDKAALIEHAQKIGFEVSHLFSHTLDVKAALNMEDCPVEVFTALGLMSGTSMDGIDVALLRTDGVDIVERGPNAEFPYDNGFRDLLGRAIKDAKGMTNRNMRPGALGESESQLTHLHVEAIDSFLQQNELTSSEIDIIGFHGQTVLHRPEIGLTVQLGDGAALATATGIDVAYDLRAADMVAGGQGAPLAPAYHRAVATRLDARPVVFVNIGGVANVTFIGADGTLIAFDTGPGNVLVDEWVQHHAGLAYDDDGKIAAGGAVDPARIAQMLDNDYFALAPPKSLDRYDFAADEVEGMNLANGAATLTAFTAASLAKAQDHFPDPAKAWVICGGGARNSTLMQALSAELPGEVMTANALGLDSATIEAEAFAYLAVRARKGLPLTFPATTGVSAPVTGGIIAQSPLERTPSSSRRMSR